MSRKGEAFAANPIGASKLIRQMLRPDQCIRESMNLFTTPCKTTLAMCIANQTKSHFETISAVLAGKAELREVIDQAVERCKLYRQRTILFVKHVLQTLMRIY
jgi:putative ATPase